MEDVIEPVHVFVRIRPELEEITGGKARAGAAASPSTHMSSASGLSATSPPPYCVAALDEGSLKLMPPDGIYASRKTVSAVDDKIYHFDRVFDEATTQEEVYDSVASQVAATVHGYNATIFAYGVTGSGKTYTMTGNKAAPGIIPRAIGDIFRHIEQAANQREADMYFFVRLSYVELYNNTFRNLLENVSKELLPTQRSIGSNFGMSGFFSELDELDAVSSPLSMHASFSRPTASSKERGIHSDAPVNRSEKIEVRESPSAGVFLAGPNLRFPVTSAVEAFQLIAKGNKYRATASTNCNEESSRSHAILTFHVESRIMSPQADGTTKSEIRLGKIHLVDLAGSERLGLSGADGDTLTETKNINSSLSALGDVLSALSKNAMVANQQQQRLLKSASAKSADQLYTEKQLPALTPVPYRNSKLTHLLKDSLGGNSKTIMITTIRKTVEYYPQTSVSLMYAARAKKVKNRSSVNRNFIGDSGIHAVSSEIERLKKSLENREQEFGRLRVMQLNDAKENSVLKARLQEMKAANEAEKRMLEEQVSQLIVSHVGQISNQKEKISQLQQALQDELTVSQNRIAEQEQEILWLKKALDETNQSSQSQDQIEKMQHIVDVWQTQAKNAHQELKMVLKQAEELKQFNTILESKLNDLQLEKTDLEKEVRKKQEECSSLHQFVENLSKEKNHYVETIDATKKSYEDLKKMLKEQVQVNLERDHLLKENTRLIETLQKDQSKWKEKFEHEYQLRKGQEEKHTKRIRELETENGSLNHRLLSSLGDLEKRTQEMIQDANQKIVSKERDLIAAHQTIDDLQRRLYDHQQELHQNQSLQTQLGEKLRQIESGLLNAEKEKASLQTQLQKKQFLVDEMTTSIQTKDQKMKETMANHLKQEGLLQEQIQTLQLSLYEQQRKYEAEKHELVSECEGIVHQKHQQFQQELQILQQQYQEKVSKLSDEHQQVLQQQQQELEAAETAFHQKLQQTEQKVREMIEFEVHEGLIALEQKHRKEMEEYETAKAEALNRQRQLFDAQTQQLLAEQAQQLQKQHQQALQELAETSSKKQYEALNQLRDQFLQEKQDILSSTDRNYQEIIAKEQERYEAALQHQQATWQANQQQAMQQLEQQHQQQVEALKRRLESQHALAIEELQQSQEQIVSQLRQSHKAEVEQQTDRSTKEINAIKQKWQQKYDRDLKQLKEQQEQRIAALEASHQTVLDKCCSDYESKLNGLLQSKAEELMQLRDALSKQRNAQLETSFQHQMELVKIEYAREKAEALQQVQAEYNERLRQEQEEFRNQLQNIQQRFTANKEQNLKGMESTYQQLLQQKDKEIATKVQLVENKKEEEKLLALKELKESYEQLLEQRTQRTVEEVNGEFAKQKQELLQKFKQEYGQQLQDALRSQEEELRQRFDEQLLELTRQFDVEKQLMNEEREVSIQAAVQAAVRKEREHFNAKIVPDYDRKAQKALQLQREEMEKQYEEKLSRLSQELAVEKDRQFKEIVHQFERKLQEKDEKINLVHQQMKEMNLRHKEDVEKLAFDQEKEVVLRYQREIEKLRGDRVDLLAFHQAELNTLVAEHQQDVQIQRNKLEELHEKVVATLREEIRSLRGKMSQHEEALQSRDAVALEMKLAVRAEYEEEMRVKRAKLQEDQQKSIQALQQQQQQEITRYKQLIDVLQQEYQEDMRQKDLLHDEELQRVKNRLKKENEALKAKYEEEINAMRNDVLTKKESELAYLQDELMKTRSQRSAQLQELEVKHRDAHQTIADLTAKFNAEKLQLMQNYQLQLDVANTRHQEQLQEAETKYTDAQRLLQTRQEQQLQLLQQQHDLERQEIRSEQQAALAQTQDEHEKQLQSLRQSLFSQQTTAKLIEDQLRNLLRESEDQRQQLRAEVEDLKRAFSAEKQSLVAHYEQIMQQRSAEQRGTMERALSDMRQQTEEELVGVEERLKIAEEQLFSSQEQNAELITACDELKSFYERQLQTLQDQILRLEESQRELAEATAIERHERQSQFQRRLEELQSSRDQTLQTLEAHNKQLQGDLERLVGEKDELLLQYNDVNLSYQQLSDSYRQLQQSLADEQEHYEALQSLRQELLNERAMYSKEQAEIASVHQQELAELQESVQQEIRELKQRLEEEQDALLKSLQHAETQLEQTLKEKESLQLALEARQGDKEQAMIRVEEANQALKRELEEMRLALTRLETEKANLLRNAADEKAVICAEAEKSREAVRQAAAEEKETLRRSIDQEQAELLKRFEQEKQALEQRWASEKAALLLRLEQDKATYMTRIEADQKKLLESLEQEKAAQAKLLEQERKQLVADMEADYRRKERELLSSYEQQLQESHAECQTQRQMLVNQRLQHAQELSQCRQSHATELRQRMETAHAEREAALAQLQTEHMLALQAKDDQLLQWKLLQEKQSLQASQLKNSHDEELHSMQQGLSDRLDELNQALVTERDQRQRWQQQCQRAQLTAEQSQRQTEELRQALQRQDEELSRLRREKQLLVAAPTMMREMHLDAAPPGSPEIQENKRVEDLSPLASMGRSLPPSMAFAQASQTELPTTHSVALDSSDFWSPPHAAAPSEDISRSSLSCFPRTPIHILVSAANASRPAERPYLAEASTKPAATGANHLFAGVGRVSATEQLIAAILDGDVQGLRTVVKSHGQTLSTGFWQEAMASALPLHRAIAGLHFHGSEKLLVAMVEALLALGADVAAVDHAGCGVLHKAIHTCTSKNIAAVLTLLLSKGAPVNLRNKDGDSPLLAECRRARRASAEVVDALIDAGADVCLGNPQQPWLTPLPTLLLSAASASALGQQLLGAMTHAPMLASADETRGAAEALAGRKVWIKAAVALVRAGAPWDASWRAPGESSLLHCFFAAFPPPRDESHWYRDLLRLALLQGADALQPNLHGVSPVMIFAQQLAKTSLSAAPDCGRLLHLLIEHHKPHDPCPAHLPAVIETVANSCWHSCRALMTQFLHAVAPSGGVASRSRALLTSASYECEREVPRVAATLLAAYSQGPAPRSTSSLDSYSVRSQDL